VRIDPAVGRFAKEPEERQVEFRHQLGTFLRLYSFLTQLGAPWTIRTWRSSSPSAAAHHQAEGRQRLRAPWPSTTT
jgi:hypothetical protein